MLYFIDNIAIDMLFVHRQYFENTREGQGEIYYKVYSIDNIAIDMLFHMGIGFSSSKIDIFSSYQRHQNFVLVLKSFGVDDHDKFNMLLNSRTELKM